MSLPLPWVDRVFEKLTLVYGQAFLARWRDIDLNAVKSDWCHEMAGMEKSPSRIAFALANLPERPPSVIEFRALCRSAPVPDVPKLPEPKADPERVAQELAKLRNTSLAQPMQSVGCKDWARRILRRVEQGDKTVSRTAWAMAANALRADAQSCE